MINRQSFVKVLNYCLRKIQEICNPNQELCVFVYRPVKKLHSAPLIAESNFPFFVGAYFIFIEKICCFIVIFLQIAMQK